MNKFLIRFNMIKGLSFFVIKNTKRDENFLKRCYNEQVKKLKDLELKK